MMIAPPRTAAPEHAYAPPRLGAAYTRFRDVALRHPDWDVSYTGDADGGAIYTAAHRDAGVQVTTDSLDTFAVLLNVSAAQMPDTAPPANRVRPDMVAWERRQAEQEARDLAAIALVTADVPVGWSP